MTDRMQRQGDFDGFLAFAEKRGIKLLPWQEQYAEKVLVKGGALLTPGVRTGKTTVLKLLEEWAKEGA